MPWVLDLVPGQTSMPLCVPVPLHFFLPASTPASLSSSWRNAPQLTPPTLLSSTAHLLRELSNKRPFLARFPSLPLVFPHCHYIQGHGPGPWHPGQQSARWILAFPAPTIPRANSLKQVPHLSEGLVSSLWRPQLL